MDTKILLKILIMTILFTTTTFAQKSDVGKFTKGLESYKKGDYIGTKNQFESLIEDKNESIENRVDAAMYLGKMYAQSLGVKKDLDEAIKWYGFVFATTTIDLPEASYELAMIYKEIISDIDYKKRPLCRWDFATKTWRIINRGESGVPDNYEEHAYEWLLEQSSHSKFAPALFELGVHYIDKATEQHKKYYDDYYERFYAYLYFYLYLQSGDKKYEKEANDYLVELAEKMLPHQIKTAKFLANNYFKTKDNTKGAIEIDITNSDNKNVFFDFARLKYLIAIGQGGLDYAIMSISKKLSEIQGKIAEDIYAEVEKSGVSALNNFKIVPENYSTKEQHEIAKMYLDTREMQKISNDPTIEKFHDISGVTPEKAELMAKHIAIAYKFLLSSAHSGYAPAQSDLGKLLIGRYSDDKLFYVIDKAKNDQNKTESIIQRPYDKLDVNHYERLDANQYKEAVEWFFGAASQGDIDAADILSWHYLYGGDVPNFYGSGVPKNIAVAYALHYIAVEGKLSKMGELEKASLYARFKSSDLADLDTRDVFTPRAYAGQPLKERESQLPAHEIEAGKKLVQLLRKSKDLKKTIDDYMEQNKK